MLVASFPLICCLFFHQWYFISIPIQYSYIYIQVVGYWCGWSLIFLSWPPYPETERWHGDSPDIHWRRSRQASTSPVNTKAATLMTFMFPCTKPLCWRIWFHCWEISHETTYPKAEIPTLDNTIPCKNIQWKFTKWFSCKKCTWQYDSIKRTHFLFTNASNLDVCCMELE